MSKHVHEIMNHEVLMLEADETADDALGWMMALGVSGVPVVDAARKPIGVVSWRNLVGAPRDASIGERMTTPAVVVTGDDTIAHAADVLAERGIHRPVVVDAQGLLVGALSIVDVLRALTGHAVRHPAEFPHLDRATGIAWTDDEPFELPAFDVAPRGPGVLVLIESVVGEPDELALVEAPASVRARLHELLSVPQPDRPDIARLLEHPARLRFRATAIEDARMRDAVARALRSRMTRELRAQVLR